jgi:hypothetical protein
MVTLTNGKFLLLTCMYFWVCGISWRLFACAPTAYEVVRERRKFEKHRADDCQRDRWNKTQYKIFVRKYLGNRRLEIHICELEENNKITFKLVVH